MLANLRLIDDYDAMSLERGVILEGFMGAGKTEVGQEITHRLNMPVIDTDSLASEIAGYDEPSEIIAAIGIDGFRVVEFIAIKRALSLPGQRVTSLGGGYVDYPHSERLIGRQRRFPVVYLSANFDTLSERARNDTNNIRPLLDDDAKERFLRREPIYRRLADFTVYTIGRSIEQVADEVIEVTDLAA